jgi:hypothetical protein
MEDERAFNLVKAAPGEVWGHCQNGQTVEVHLVLSVWTCVAGIHHHRLLNLVAGVTHADVLIGSNATSSHGWHRIA